MEDVKCGVERQFQLIARFNQNCIVVLGLYRTGDCLLYYIVWRNLIANWDAACLQASGWHCGCGQGRGRGQ